MNQETIQHCSRCGAETCGDDITTFDGEALCPSCLERYTALCEHCGERIWLEDNAGDSTITLCRDCYDDHYTNCERCNCIIHEDYSNYIGDIPYCDDCYDKERSHPIHDYSYKPDPIFYGNGKRFFGVELEIDDGGKDDDNADILLDIANSGNERIYIKCDGSLDDGMEIVTHPMTLDYHKNQMPWEEIMDEAISLGYKSHKSGTCGLHIHVNRETFGNTREAQDDAISRVLYFVEHHWNELLKFSRRTESQMNQWAARYGYKNNPKDILDHAKKEEKGRYTCVNITNWNTVEFRMFRGTLKYNTLIATLELVNRICNLAVHCDDVRLAKLSWSDFVMSLNESDCAELITYLKERRLYVNAPVEREEDE
ncbi:MAG: amidoligase family protein [Oscillospiraceae bacterium]|nr:amidoligase family protein [Oscillospiraceae bacterium]